MINTSNIFNSVSNNVSTTVSNTFNSLKTKVKAKFDDSINNVDNFSELVIYFTCFIIILLIVVWVLNIYTLDSRNCSYMNQLYINFPILRNIEDSMITPNKNDHESLNNYGHRLYDYYIKTAYNCCNAGNYKNDFVNLCALRNCIKQGVRCLDMQIYSLNDQPVVATASFDDNTTKETYNSLPLSTVLNTIYEHGFNKLFCPNWKDPLIIHFRIMSNNKIIYNKIAKLLKQNLKDKLLDSKYSYENRNTNLGKENLLNFNNKIIIALDRSNKTFIDTKLHEFINISSNSYFMRLLRYTNGVKLTPDMNELIEYNKTNLSLCLPDLSSKILNPSFDVSKQYGVHLTAMSFQNNDDNLKIYNKHFSELNHAFILKPLSLRHIPETVSVETVSPELYLSSDRGIAIPVGLGKPVDVVV